MNGIQGLLAATQRGLGSLKVVMATGLYKTAAGVVGQRVLKENTTGLRAYLTVHLRGIDAAQKALAGIEDAVEHGNGDDLTKGPSKRAALFLAAKNVVEYERLFGDGTADQPMHAVPWAPTAPGRIDGWGRALDEIRFGLGGAEAEILQLHHACGLNESELSYVLGVRKDDVARRLEAGSAYAKLLLDDVLPGASSQLEQVLKEAYEVLEPTPEQLAATKPKVVPLPVGTVIGDRYEIDSLLGGGEFAYVYRARDVRVPGHVVALKLLHRVARTQAAREGAIRELSLIASAFHPSLVQFKDHGWFEERLWFVMPFYEGEMLLDRLERGSLPLDEALSHFERLARGLAALHAGGIRHQDVKPENIFLVRLATGASEDKPEVFPILLDLGVAAPSGEMALAGTPMYFPPEVAARIFDEECDLPLTAKADVFALALSLLHSLEEPDFGDVEKFDVDDFLKKRVHFVPKGPNARPLRFLRPRFDKWLAHHPSDRPTAGQMADEIAEVMANMGGRGRRLPAPRGLRVAAVTTAMMSILLVVSMSVDTPAPRRDLAPPTTAPSNVGVSPNTAPVDASERERLLRNRLDTEERRNAALEDELARLRRIELGLSDAGEAVEDDEPETEDEPEPPTRDRRAGPG